jgi:hypothetical protein
LVLLTLAGLPPRASAQTTLLPYGSSGYRYQVQVDPFPTEVASPAFDDSSWPIGTAMFSNGDRQCTGLPPVGTNWPANYRLAARYRLSLLGVPSGSVLHFFIDNDVDIYINGTLVTSVLHILCPLVDEYVQPVPTGLLHGGENVLVAVAADQGTLSAFDMRLTADFVTPARRSSWGTLKACYR